MKCITTDEEKRDVFEATGVDVLVEFPFDAVSAAMEPERFVKDILTGKLGADIIIAGDDFTFGRDGAGNAALLQELSEDAGFVFRSIPKTVADGAPVSSTRIRKLLSEGKMEEAAALMGRPYSISAVISHGRSLGRKLGMPTINQLPEEDKFLPPFGVYYSETFIDGVRYEGITNIGIKPTVSDYDLPVAETHLYDFDMDVYGKEAVTGFISFRRPEQKFASLAELEKILETDMEAGRRFHEERRYAQ